jgi:hypothetical protein
MDDRNFSLRFRLDISADTDCFVKDFDEFYALFFC